MDRLDIADWRRRVSSLYAAVRETDDPAKAHALWCRGRDDLLSHHPASPIPAAVRHDYLGPQVAPYDPAYRFVVAVERTDRASHTVDVGHGATVDLERIGQLTLPDLGTLDVWWLLGYCGGVFLPLRDAATTSYQGGRYVWDSVNGADLGTTKDGMVVDLNFCYQPSCAYSPQWTCPLPAEGNRLEAEVPVGEWYRPALSLYV